jgi:hypothetical protein
VDSTPAVLFTYNAEFDSNRPSTRRRDEQKNNILKILESMREYGVKESQIFVVPKEEHTYPTYVSESNEIIRKFFSFYRIPPKSHIFSDDGKCFKEGQVDVLFGYHIGFEYHTTFLPEIHY